MAEPVALGMDIGGTKLVAATVTADGEVLDRRRRRTPARDERRLVDDLGEIVDELGGGLPIGIGIAGAVTPDGVVRYGPNIPAVHDLALAEALARWTTAPVTVVNDASAAAFGEQRAGAARGRSHVLLLTLGTGVGGGVVVAGRLLVGANGFAGELGHVVVEADGRPCPCGGRGCLEAYAAGPAIARRATEWLGGSPRPSLLRDAGGLTGKDVSHAAAEGDELAREVLAEAGRWLGVAIVGLVNAFDPETVLLGGGAALETSPWLVPPARTVLAERIFGAPWRAPPAVELAGLGDDAGMVGAGLLAADRARAG